TCYRLTSSPDSSTGTDSGPSGPYIGAGFGAGGTNVGSGTGSHYTGKRRKGSEADGTAMNSTCRPFERCLG
ncbi:hypothetical protein KI387_008106, partial [Taxus chinensis]